MVIEMKELETKLRRERLERCVNCKKLGECEEERKEEIEECVDFEEVEGEAWVIKKIAGIT